MPSTRARGRGLRVAVSYAGTDIDADTLPTYSKVGKQLHA